MDENDRAGSIPKPGCRFEVELEPERSRRVSGRRGFVISDQEYEGQFILVLELAEQVQEAQLCTQQFLTIIDALPDAAMDVWRACTSRTFSYGFDGGADHPALDTTISADLLRRIARIDADIGITVYPFRQSQALHR